MKNQVQLVAYVDRLCGGSLRDLHALLATPSSPLHGLFGGVHLLPFYHRIDGADAGFDPIDHLKVDERLGDWRDVAALAAQFELMADVIVNHMSSESPQFLDYSARGAVSPFNGLFLTQDAVFPKGISAADLAAIYRPRPGSPFTPMLLQNGEQALLWTTFTPQQIDIDVGSAAGQVYLGAILRQLAEAKVRMARLDAVGYAIKKPGTSCFMLPETFDFIARFAVQAKALGIDVLVEIHAHYETQIEIAKHVDWVYDFALPPLLLHALHFNTAAALKKWLVLRPHNAVTVLDTHDGIGIIDIGADRGDRVGKPGLIPDDELDELVECLHVASGGQSRLATGAAASNLDLYQVNCTYYDALGRQDQDYLIARAVQFFIPGVPQVYYVGMLAGENDMDLLARTQVGRDINRHCYRREEVEASVAKPVVQKLMALIRLRNRHPAFNGRFSLLPSEQAALVLRWEQGSDWIQLDVNLPARTLGITGTDCAEVAALGASS